MQLECSNERCATALERSTSTLECPRCGDLLQISYGSLPQKAAELKRVWRERRSSNAPADRSGVWRFRELLPCYETVQPVTMGEGNTPLLRAQKSAEYAGVGDLRFKHQGWNPTGSFKDTGMTVAVTEAKARGAGVVACASTGNTAASMAAYAARAGLTARVYTPRGKISKAKLAQSIDYGAQIVEIEGNFDDALAGLVAMKDQDLYFLNSINPFRIEGQKTIIFELLEQLEWEPPDYIVLPAGNLGNTSALGKALMEAHAAGLLPRVPRLVSVQAAGANAFVRTWEGGGESLKKVTDPHTAATAICIGAPASWRKAVRAIRFTNGMVLDVTDAEIMEAKRAIGRDGIGCEPASAATLAGIRKLVSEGKMEPGARIVAVLTGHVLKDTEAILAGPG